MDLSLVALKKLFKKMLWWSKKALNLAKLATLRASLLTSHSVWLQQHTYQTYTHVQEYLDHGQSEGGPPFTISDWFRSRYGPNVCLLLNHRETLLRRLFFFSNGWSHQRSCSMKIFCKCLTINVSKLHFWLVICIAKNFIWTTLKMIFSIFW